MAWLLLCSYLYHGCTGQNLSSYKGFMSQEFKSLGSIPEKHLGF